MCKYENMIWASIYGIWIHQPKNRMYIFGHMHTLTQKANVQTKLTIFLIYIYIYIYTDKVPFPYFLLVCKSSHLPLMLSDKKVSLHLHDLMDLI